MCGIAGILVTREHGQRVTEAEIDGMLGVIQHRGPDEAGTLLFRHGGIGHVRLAIIDLAQGQQPMRSQKHWITFNGELFNHVELREELKAVGVSFDSKSDTEVILKAYQTWGKDCLQKFNGQFAFCIVNTETGHAFFARDPFGERPLYYGHHKDRFYFGSEAKAILSRPEFPRHLDHEALSSATGSWTVQPHQSSFEGIQQVPPGHYMQFSPQEKNVIKPYYRLPSMGTALADDQQTLNTLSKSVELRLRSDVPVGTYLSGGLDSSITTALACQKLSQVHSYSVSFDHSEYDESHEQNLAAQHLKSIHHDLKISEAEIAAHFPKVVYHSESPQFRTAAAPLYLLAQMVNSDGLKVVLTGEGADEFFLGYNIFKEMLFRKKLPQLDDDLAALELSQLYPYLPHFQAGNAKRQLPAFKKRHYSSDLLSHDLRFKNSEWCHSLFQLPNTQTATEQWLQTLNLEGPYSDLSDMEKTQKIEILSLLHGYLLSSQGDRMSMAHGLESRCPFLDPNVVSYAQSLDGEQKLKYGKIEKHCLKSAFAQFLPKDISQRPKQPYRAMEADTIVKQSPEWLMEICSQEKLSTRTWLNGNKAHLLMEKTRKNSRMSPREQQALALIISVSILEHQYIEQRPIGSLKLTPTRYRA
jgi:asparagine synthase (glutamine-hydrolysing)